MLAKRLLLVASVAIEGKIGDAREEHHGAGMWWSTLRRGLHAD